MFNCAANLKLVGHGLAVLTWGNVSGISEDRCYVVIKPSGVDYATMKLEHMVVINLDGTMVEGICVFPLTRQPIWNPIARFLYLPPDGRGDSGNL